MGAAGSVTEDRPGTARQNRRNPASLPAEMRVADREHSPVHAVQSSSGAAVPHTTRSEAEGFELRQRNDAVLPRRQVRDLDVERTRSSFRSASERSLDSDRWMRRRRLAGLDPHGRSVTPVGARFTTPKCQDGRETRATPALP